MTAGESTGRSRAERGGLRVVDGEDLGQPGDPEDLQQAVLGADELHRAVVGPHLLQAADEDTEPRRVEEVDALHVDDEIEMSVAYQLGDLVPELGSRVDVDLPADGDDRAAVDLTSLQRKVHCLSSERDLGCGPRPHAYVTGADIEPRPVVGRWETG